MGEGANLLLPGRTKTGADNNIHVKHQVFEIIEMISL
jgi:hypothetical protein